MQNLKLFHFLPLTQFIWDSYICSEFLFCTSTVWLGRLRLHACKRSIVCSNPLCSCLFWSDLPEILVEWWISKKCQLLLALPSWENLQKAQTLPKMTLNLTWTFPKCYNLFEINDFSIKLQFCEISTISYTNFSFLCLILNISYSNT